MLRIGGLNCYMTGYRPTILSQVLDNGPACMMTALKSFKSIIMYIASGTSENVTKWLHAMNYGKCTNEALQGRNIPTWFQDAMR